MTEKAALPAWLSALTVHRATLSTYLSADLGHSIRSGGIVQEESAVVRLVDLHAAWQRHQETEPPDYPGYKREKALRIKAEAERDDLKAKLAAGTASQPSLEYAPDELCPKCGVVLPCQAHQLPHPRAGAASRHIGRHCDICGDNERF